MDFVAFTATNTKSEIMNSFQVTFWDFCVKLYLNSARAQTVPGTVYDL